jgi:hypothetical protein
MPDAPAAEPPGETNAASALIRNILDRWPEWTPHVISGGRVDGVRLSVPPPEHPSHRLEVVCRDDAFEIAYDCGQPGLRAAATFGLADRAAASSCVCEFLREVRDGEMVVLVRPRPLFTSNRARSRAQFRSVSRSVQYSRECVYEWHTQRSGDVG